MSELDHINPTKREAALIQQYNKALEIVASVSKERIEAIAALQQAQADAAAMRDALEFYSDSKRWIQCEASGTVCDEIDDGDPMMVFKDGEEHPWSVAKKALAANSGKAILARLEEARRLLSEARNDINGSVAKHNKWCLDADAWLKEGK